MKNYLFARICRVIGRFLLAIGTVFLLGSIVLLFMPKPTSSTTDESSLSRATIYSIIHNADVAPITQNTENRIAVTALGIVLSIAIIVVFGLVMRRYNDDIRRIIGKIAKTTKLSIHQTELLLTTFVWGIVVHITVFHAPLFAIPAIAALIFNELFFIFAFVGYRCKDYTL